MSAPIEEIEREKSNREEEEDYLRENLYPDFSYITWSCIYHLSGESVGEMTLLVSSNIRFCFFCNTTPTAMVVGGGDIGSSEECKVFGSCDAIGSCEKMLREINDKVILGYSSEKQAGKYIIFYAWVGFLTT